MTFSLQAVTKEGYLMKQKWKFHQRWRRRYFRLKGHKLYYSKDADEVSAFVIHVSDLYSIRWTLTFWLIQSWCSLNTPPTLYWNSSCSFELPKALQAGYSIWLKICRLCLSHFTQKHCPPITTVQGTKCLIDVIQPKYRTKWIGIWTINIHIVWMRNHHSHRWCQDHSKFGQSNKFPANCFRFFKDCWGVHSECVSLPSRMWVSWCHLSRELKKERERERKRNKWTSICVPFALSHLIALAKIAMNRVPHFASTFDIVKWLTAVEWKTFESVTFLFNYSSNSMNKFIPFMSVSFNESGTKSTEWLR